MRLGRSPSPNSNRTRVVVLTADAEFDHSVRAIFGASSAIELTMVSGRIAERSDKLDVENATVVVVAVSYTHLRAHETRHDLVCRLLLEKKKNTHTARFLKILSCKKIQKLTQ